LKADEVKQMSWANYLPGVGREIRLSNSASGIDAEIVERIFESMTS